MINVRCKQYVHFDVLFRSMLFDTLQTFLRLLKTSHFLKVNKMKETLVVACTNLSSKQCINLCTDTIKNELLPALLSSLLNKQCVMTVGNDIRKTNSIKYS